ncbi:MAG: hypothetical protein WD491_06815 [Balneolales bacterium]
MSKIPWRYMMSCWGKRNEPGWSAYEPFHWINYLSKVFIQPGYTTRRAGVDGLMVWQGERL